MEKHCILGLAQYQWNNSEGYVYVVGYQTITKHNKTRHNKT